MKSKHETVKSKTRLSIMVWGYYLVMMGLLLIVIPQQILMVMGFETATELWPRMTGLLSTVLGLYYLMIVYYRIQILYRWKIAGHLIGIITMIVLFSTDNAPSAIIPTAVTELVAAIWTVISLKADHLLFPAGKFTV
jgi:hypothetical protein